MFPLIEDPSHPLLGWRVLQPHHRSFVHVYFHNTILELRIMGGKRNEKCL